MEGRSDSGTAGLGGVDAPNGMPLIGLGTCQLKGADCEQSVCDALRLGYRLIDTARCYK
jgi:2,5-diketo-D-gluconate reductase A